MVLYKGLINLVFLANLSNCSPAIMNHNISRFIGLSHAILIK